MANVNNKKNDNKTINVLCWNVNGLRAVLKKGFLDFLQERQPDLLGIQETKLQEPQIPKETVSPLGYQSNWSFAERKGYSGTAVFSKSAPVAVKTEFEDDVLNHEGRVVQLDFDEFILFNIYFPNGQKDEERLNYKLSFYDSCLSYFEGLRKQGRKLVIMGDYNTAHKPIDLANPKRNESVSGFLPIERAWLDKITEAGYVDTFRQFNNKPEQYTWWSYRFKSRDRNIGWRIDYFFVTEDMMPFVKDSYILSDVYGSDHCPLGLTLEFPS